MPEITTIKSLEQGRASFALTCAQSGAKHAQCAKYKSHVKKMPMMIKTNGLGSTIAFAFSKKNGSDKTWDLLVTHVENWLVMKGHLVENKSLHLEVVKVDSNDYRALTVEVLAFLNWLRRFAEGLIEKDDDDDQG